MTRLKKILLISLMIMISFFTPDKLIMNETQAAVNPIPGCLLPLMITDPKCFGFQIKENVFCECSFNHRYKPARLGYPAPAPPLWFNRAERRSGGSLATTPFGVPLPGITQDEYDYGVYEKRRWVLGQTHTIPIPMVCLNLVLTWTGLKCKREWGWLWLRIGSSDWPDYTIPKL